MQLLTNHIGYQAIGSKRAVVMSPTALTEINNVFLVDATTHAIVLELPLSDGAQVDQWHQGYFFDVDFSEWTQPGEYYLSYQSVCSHRFQIANHRLLDRAFSDMIHYFKSQRCSDSIFDNADQVAKVIGSNERVDVHGGWYDASGDVSKYLSHLSYANYLNPQQTPMVVWNLLKADDALHDSLERSFLQTRLHEEALYGAEFLLRMQHPDGYFYMTIFDKWSKDTEQREICAYETQLGHKTSDYQAGFRQGGGMAIAALAKTSRLAHLTADKEQQFLAAAESGYAHLKQHNTEYLNDGTENIIDEYCALLASVELYRSTQQSHYLVEARYWADALAQRATHDEQFAFYWSSNDDGSRPYYHAAEAGLPVIALNEYVLIEDDSSRTQRFIALIHKACQFELNVTQEVFNPFGYPRQYVKPIDEAKRSAFFVPHNNESGYWWQGENARLASLATMALTVQPHLDNPVLKAELEDYAARAMDWILGFNPYDMCMLDGHGHNNPDYLTDLGFFNAHGGVCNGITAGFDNECDIAFNPLHQKDDMLQNWRWGEQWIPHAAWLLLATALTHKHYQQKETSHA
ncbi:glycoside hydrolase family 9 protein [Vibrio methylphosphonaticus]|uniref:glycoside hydrolase family 9 protein n=1 Tax=Vibrio methylphosphonaticus TaxID=2946866 RepID=UPI00202A5C25|nr:glycoside hydrolase family 9 protein [Vibrio methylphosphonaticus]MCL9775074.1 glycoside hydrolase family 9 protein [Vibrio methylphosphonaticus]